MIIIITINTAIIIIIIIIIKSMCIFTCAKKNVYKLLSQLIKHLRNEKLKKNTAQGSNQRLTEPLNPSNVPVSSTM